MVFSGSVVKNNGNIPFVSIFLKQKGKGNPEHLDTYFFEPSPHQVVDVRFTGGEEGYQRIVMISHRTLHLMDLRENKLFLVQSFTNLHRGKKKIISDGITSLSMVRGNFVTSGFDGAVKITKFMDSINRIK